MFARQHQRRAFVAAREDEERRAKRRDRFEPHRAAGFKTGENASAHALIAGAAGKRELAFDGSKTFACSSRRCECIGSSRIGSGISYRARWKLGAAGRKTN